MTNFKKNYKKLYKNYDKRLKAIHKESFGNGRAPLDYFVTYLQFLRDQRLLTSPLLKEEMDTTSNVELTSIVAALSEYEYYEECIENYYIIENNVVVHKPEFTEEEARTKFQEERLKHWEAFWNLVKLCIEGWEIND
jgi:hypothetical protein